jgi:hypothetical protein
VPDHNDHDFFFVIAGGPGSGKTALIDALERAGYARTVEAGRAIIQDKVAIGGAALPWSNPAMFAELMLSFDRSSPDRRAASRKKKSRGRGEPCSRRRCADAREGDIGMQLGEIGHPLTIMGARRASGQTHSLTQSNTDLRADRTTS